MSIKNVEIYFLYASSMTRWATTFCLLVLIFFLWWYYAFSPLNSKLKALHNTYQSMCSETQHADTQAALAADTATALKKKLAFVGSPQAFLKDLLNHGLKTTSVTIEKADPALAAVHAHSLKISFNAPFEKFYEFLREHQRNYLCVWNSCVCTKSPEKLLSINADIVIYSK